MCRVTIAYHSAGPEVVQADYLSL